MPGVYMLHQPEATLSAELLTQDSLSCPARIADEATICQSGAKPIVFRAAASRWVRPLSQDSQLLGR